MGLINYDTDGGTLRAETEAEEIYAPVAKLVKASDFHSDNRGFEPHQEYSKNMNTNWTKWFNSTAAKNIVVDGRPMVRLGMKDT